MSAIVVAVLAFVGYILAYRFYGRYISRRLFGLRDTTDVPAHKQKDGVDFVPTSREVLLGHHFTTISGVGPIVGPALGVIWGWVPALLWVVFGSIFIGAVHDFGALVISARQQGRSIGEVSKTLLSPAVRTVFMLIIAVLLWVVLAIFAFVIALLFVMYPTSVVPIWLEIPIAFWLGWAMYKRKWSVKWCALAAVAMMYATVYLGTQYPVSFDVAEGYGVEAGTEEAALAAKEALQRGSFEEARKVVGAKVAKQKFHPRAMKKAAPTFPAARIPLLLSQWKLTVVETLTRPQQPPKTTKKTFLGQPLRCVFKDKVGGALLAVVLKTGGGERLDLKAGKEKLANGAEREVKLKFQPSGKVLEKGAWTPLCEVVSKNDKRRFYLFKAEYVRLLTHPDAVVLWIVLLLIYIYVASTLPVHWLLQPRDYINSHELYVAMGLVAIGLFASAPVIVAPAFNTSVVGAPAFFPFLFVIIACGAISGFHALAASGTTVKQLSNEKDALPVGYGAMLLEAVLATLVIMACTAGFPSLKAWLEHYASWGAAQGLGAKLSAFINGSCSFIETLGVPFDLAAAILAVLVVSFAATTLDSACRIQRYVVAELAQDAKIPVLPNRYVASLFAVATAAILAFIEGSGKGGLILWPLFGTVNQLLAGLVFVVITIYLLKRGIKTPLVFLPMLFLIVTTTWALVVKIIDFGRGHNWLLFGVGIAVALIEAVMLVEAARAFARNWRTPKTNSF